MSSHQTLALRAELIAADRFFVAADLAFGKMLVCENTTVVEAAGGKVLRSVYYPSPVSFAGHE